MSFFRNVAVMSLGLVLAGQTAVLAKPAARVVKAKPATAWTTTTYQTAPWTRRMDIPGHPLEMEGNSRRGLDDGAWTSYYPNGQPKLVINYRDGVPHGHMTAWYESGRIMGDGYFTNGFRDGNWRYYYTSGRPLAAMQYKDHDPSGHWLRWWESGRVQESGNFRIGKREGTWTSYYADGHPRTIMHYAGGVTQGRQLSYYSNGVKPEFPVWVPKAHKMAVTAEDRVCVEFQRGWPAAWMGMPDMMVPTAVVKPGKL